MGKNFLCFAVLLFCPISFYGQETDIMLPKPEKDSIYTKPTILPEYKEGGLKGFYEYIYKLYRVPKAFRGRDRMMVVFVVDVDGKLTDIKVIKDIGAGTATEIIKVLKGSPKWKPGYNAEGKPVKTFFSLPIIISKD